MLQYGGIENRGQSKDASQTAACQNCGASPLPRLRLSTERISNHSVYVGLDLSAVLCAANQREVAGSSHAGIRALNLSEDASGH